MKKIALLLIIGLLHLQAYSDADLDGVDDKVDKCPNTPFMALVDINGCTKKLLVKKKRKQTKSHYDVIIGANYSGSNYASLNQTDTYSTSLQVDYYYKNYSFQASTSYFKTTSSSYDDTGLNDSFVGVSYMFKPQKSLSVRVGGGLILPTYDTSLNNNNMDYTTSLNLSYAYNKFNFFGGAVYTLIEDDDVAGVVSYQNTAAWSLGAGYNINNKLYVSLSYHDSQSIYDGVENVQTASVYAYKSLSTHWFLTGFYAYGLSDSASDNALSLRLGYYF
jgi:hypothetical protein